MGLGEFWGTREDDFEEVAGGEGAWGFFGALGEGHGGWGVWQAKARVRRRVVKRS